MTLPASLWRDTAPDSPPRPALPGPMQVDIAIVGAGFTGLWTAHSLLNADPTLRVAILEREQVGYGASGRNGGWCSALFPTSWTRLVKAGGVSGARAMHAAMVDTVTEVGRVCADEAIEADFAHGGTIVLARSAAQLQRAGEEVATAQERGQSGLQLLDQSQALDVVNATSVLGATYTPNCAAVHPLKLVRGLADRVEALGATIYERSPVEEIRPGALATTSGSVKADVVVRATEGWTRDFVRRQIAPVYSLMVATEPLSVDIWEEIGLRRRETFSDGRHVVIYGQRTADDRLVFGGRGAPYHFGSAIRPAFDSHPEVFDMLKQTVREMFPALSGVRFTHAWGGPLGIARDWAASVGLDRTTGLAWAGGYVGDGVSTTNLAGRTLADLILSRDTDITRLPWVNHRSRSWEPEPLRWLGINAGLRAMNMADAEEARSGKQSRIARLMAPLMHG